MSGKNGSTHFLFHKQFCILFEWKIDVLHQTRLMFLLFLRIVLITVDCILSAFIRIKERIKIWMYFIDSRSTPYCLTDTSFKIWTETHSNYLITNVMFCRQHSWNWNPKKWIQPQAARVVLPPCCNRRQQLSCPKQHKHNDYSSL